MQHDIQATHLALEQQAHTLTILREQVEETKQRTMAANTNTQPSASNVRYLPAQRTKRATTTEHTNDKGQFVRSCLSENPHMRNSDIRRKANEQGLSISAGYISDIRKVLSQPDKSDNDLAQ
jgi:hypothetical protein